MSREFKAGFGMTFIGLAATIGLPAAQEHGYLTEVRAEWLMVISIGLGLLGVGLLVHAAWPSIAGNRRRLIDWSRRRRPQSPIALRWPFRDRLPNAITEASVPANRREASGKDLPPGDAGNAGDHKPSIRVYGAPQPVRDSFDIRAWADPIVQSMMTARHSATHFVGRTGGKNRINDFDRRVLGVHSELRLAIDKAPADSTVENRFVELYAAYYELVEEAHRHAQEAGTAEIVKREDYLDWCNQDTAFATALFESAPDHLAARLRQIGLTASMHLK